MKIKNLLIVLMIVAIAITCIACNGGGDDTTTTQPSVESTTPAATTTKAPQTTKAPEETTAPPVVDDTTAAPETTAAVNLDESKFTAALSIKKPESKVPAVSYSIWDGSVATSFAGGDGSKENPYLISNGAELAYLAHITNSYDPNTGINNTAGIYYKLVSDIYLNDVSDSSTWSLTNAPANIWVPIGLAMSNTAAQIEAAKFAGHFDGSGHTVFGMYVPDTYRYSGLFGNVENVQSPIKSLDTVIADGGADLCGASVQNITIAHSFAATSKYGALVVGYTRHGVLISNCIVDDTCTMVDHAVLFGTYDGGCGGVVGRAELVYMYRCINSAKVVDIPRFKTSDDGTQGWCYGNFTAGIACVLAGVAKECANFGDVYTTYNGGLGFGYLGASSMGASVIDCLTMGTLYSGWDLVDTSAVAGGTMYTIGLFASRSAHVDSYPHLALSGCVSAGKFDLDLEIASVKGRVCGSHKNITDVKDILYVDHGFSEELEIVTKWEAANQFYWTGIVSVTEAEFEALRATYPK